MLQFNRRLIRSGELTGQKGAVIKLEFLVTLDDLVAAAAHLLNPQMEDDRPVTRARIEREVREFKGMSGDAWVRDCDQWADENGEVDSRALAMATVAREFPELAGEIDEH